MITEVDEGKGLVKVYWSDVRKKVNKVEPTFAQMIDELNPDKTFPLYLAYYPYGALKGDTESPFLPTKEGGYYRLNHPNIPKDVIKHLGYGASSSPLGMVLEKNLELFINIISEGVTIPWAIYPPGSFFPFSRVLSKKSNRIYAPNGVFSTSAGARTAFLLPNVGCATHHSNLQRDFNVKSPPPKYLREHWNIFKEILNSEIINSDWRSCLLYFSEKWMNKLHKDSAWLKLRLYFHEQAWQQSEYRRNHFHYDIAFSVIQSKRNLKPNPYLADTAIHLFTTAMGAAPGYVPACNEDLLPLAAIQKAYTESYGLKKYHPTIMQPAIFKFEQDKFPIYYSLKNPSMHMFSPKSRTVSNTLFEMRELEHIMKIFIEELGNKNGMCSDAIISEIANNVEFKYFHNENDRHRTILPSSQITNFDDRFNFVTPTSRLPNARFASDAPFARGCISIKTKS